MADVASLVIRVEAMEADLAARKLENLKNAGKNAEKSVNDLSGATNALKAAFIGLGGALAFRELFKASDEFANMRSRMDLATGSAQAGAEAYAKLLGKVRESHADLISTSDLFSKLTTATKALGLSQNQVVTISDTISKSLRISGADAQESASVIKQLGQAFASGVIKGDEFNAMMENSPRLSRAMSEALGINAGELRKLAAQGVLTSEVLSKALLGQTAKINEEFKKMPQTIGTATQDIKNELMDAFGPTSSGPMVASLNEITRILQDPQTKKSLQDLGAGMMTLAGWVIKGASAVDEFGQALGYAAARITGTLPEEDKLIDRAEKLKKALSGEIFFGGAGQFLGMSQAELQADLDKTEAQIRAIGAAKAAYSRGAGPAAANDPFIDPNAAKDALGAGGNAKAHEKALKEIQDRIDSLKIEGATAGMTARQTELYKLAQQGATDADKAAVNAAYDLIEAEETHKDELKDREAIEKYIDDLTDQAAMLGMNKREIDAYKLAQLGATDADIAAADALQRKIDAYNVERDLMTQQEKKLDDLIQKRKLILSSTDGQKQTDLLGKLGKDTAADDIKGFGESKQPLLQEQLDLLKQQYDEKKALLQSQYDAQILSHQEFLDTKARLDFAYTEKEKLLKANSVAAQLGMASQMADGLAGIAAAVFGAHSKQARAMFAVSKAFQIGQAMMSAYSSATKAFDSQASIPYVGPALGAAAAAAALASGLAQVSQVKSQNFSGAYDKGGYIPSGSVGLVGEIGPELVSGPANITSRKDTMNMLRDGSGGAPPVVNLRIVNQLKDADGMMNELEASGKMEQVIYNVISRNPEMFHQAARI